MPKEFYASMTERSIGRTLRTWRDSKGRSLTEAAKLARFSTAKLSQMENAILPLDPLDIMCVGHINDRPTPEWKHQVRCAQAEAMRRAAMEEEANKASPFNPDDDFIKAFPEASVIRTFGAHAIPYILQTSSYSMTIHEDRISPIRAQRRDDARKGWLENPSCAETFAVYAVITETALRRQIMGGSGIAEAALVYLMELSEHPNVTIQVLEHGPNVDAALKSSYSHMSFPHIKHRDVIYLQDTHPGRYIEDTEICRLVRESFHVVRQSALSPDASLELIAEIASEITEESDWQAVIRSVQGG